MNSLKVLYLISLLQKTTTGKEKILAKLYENSINDNPEFKELHALLDENVFYDGIGKSLHQNGQNLIDSALGKPAEIFSTIHSMRQVNELIQHEVLSCERLLEQPDVFVEPISVLTKRNIPDYLDFLELLAATCTYLIAVYSGAQGLEQLAWPEGSGLLERIHAVNLVYLPALCQIESIPRAWLIIRKDFGGRNLLGGTFFSISYVSLQHMTVLTSGLRTERLTPHMFLNKRAAETGETETPYCWGIGNIVSASPKDGLQLLNGKVMTKPPLPSPTDVMQPPKNPVACLHRLSGGAHYCISPEELVACLNYWQMSHEITYRKKEHICIFCGKPISPRNFVCPSHFSMKGV